MISKKIIAVTFVVALLAAGCSVKKNNIISRNYHNTTARYNGFYHGKLKMKDAVDKLAEQHEDKYDRILSVFRYADKQKAKSIYPDMDEVIKKVSLVIQRHSMNIGGKERCRWIDDNWLLMGKAHFFKHDFFSAIETFEYVAATYPDETSKYEALLWLTQTNITLTKFASCEFTLDYLRSEPKFPKKLRGDMEAVLSDFYLQTRQYTQAIEHLEKAVVFTKKRDTKIRYMFILAQVYQHENQYKKAFQHYTNCIHMNPPYEMGFNARINRARCFDSENKDSKEVKKELVKMLKDEKNKDYLDQIYYALAGLAIKEPDTAKAIEHLHLSIESSKGNGNQKAMSYLDLGKIFFARRDYKAARNYYDSTMISLSNDYYEYDLVLNRRNSLTKLMKNLNT
ncbi:MAG TPA: tetratricopeptide repeat protein, partial [Bacteroidia bacterium]|nr:tetratricopeptide repeat protein [Bacteroidia bacterium]